MAAKTQTSMVPVTFGEATYIPINMDSLRLDSVPEFDLYFRPGEDQPFVLYCQRCTAFTQDARKRLAQNRIGRLYIQEGHRSEYSRYLAAHLEETLADCELSIREKSTILYDAAQAVVEDVLAQPASEKIRRGKAIVRQTVALMSSEEFLLEDLLRAISCDYYLYTHSVNVTAYSIALAMHAGYQDPATLREIANGALLHDVGKSALPKALLNKTGALTGAEWERMKHHPVRGFELLGDSGALGEVALDIVLHHHEKLDGHGYPHGLKGEAISDFVRIVTVADIFDALTSERHYQKHRGSFEALSEMNAAAGREIDRDFFRCFIEMMGSPGKSAD